MPPKEEPIMMPPPPPMAPIKELKAVKVKKDPPLSIKLHR